MSVKNDQPDMNRRKFVGTTVAAAGAVVVAPGVLLHTVAGADPESKGASAKHRWGMLIDANKCAQGCSACVDACNSEHGLTGHDRPATDAQWIRAVKLKDNSTGHINRLVMMCQHCEHPPCVDVCPTGASFKRTDGIVLVDRHICIGCRYCMMACPYKARSFVHEDLEEQSVNAPRGKGCVEGCTMCVHRIDRGETMTACQEACHNTGHGAIVFGDLKDPDSEISQALKSQNSRQIRADLKLNTGVRYSNL
ncbi:MAG: 4Fe-4S ferredoxin [Gammaproteobacteria bacterium (ex Lamellibrachia satsuma)]|nr:MAG: 4Fe-4S ferredoxin [Gammaproteobacteria bacterium (ex Lamellibrachia satsuma)]RRS35248.1 MAG: 4Fe-4S ferredoxin [Gammaproteobacteria bacterium (ex Lamellibrachia satsuma)]